MAHPENAFVDEGNRAIPEYELKHPSGSRVGILGLGAILTRFEIVLNGQRISVLESPPHKDPPGFIFHNALLGPTVGLSVGGNIPGSPTDSLPLNFPPFEEPQHNIHGFLYREPFKVVERIEPDVSDRSANMLMLRSEYDGSQPGFPHPFRTTVRLRLRKNALNYKAVIEPTASGIMVAQLGAHFINTLGVPVNQLELQSPAQRSVLAPAGVVDRDSPPFNEFLEFARIGEAPLDHLFLANEGPVTTYLYDPESDITIATTQNTPRTQIYTVPLPESTGLGVEPITNRVFLELPHRLVLDSTITVMQGKPQGI